MLANWLNESVFKYPYIGIIITCDNNAYRGIWVLTLCCSITIIEFYAGIDAHFPCLSFVLEWYRSWKLYEVLIAPDLPPGHQPLNSAFCHVIALLCPRAFMSVSALKSLHAIMDSRDLCTLMGDSIVETQTQTKLLRSNDQDKTRQARGLIHHYPQLPSAFVCLGLQFRIKACAHNHQRPKRF